jgi:hypothetical protein
MLANEKRAKICSECSKSSGNRWREFSAQNNNTENYYDSIQTLIAAALVSMTAVISASAQLPSWVATYPGSFQAQYPDRDVLNGGALTPAGRMGLELPDGAAPVFRANNAYAATGRATASLNGNHQRMSVSVVAPPRNHFRYNSLTVPV